MTEKFINNNLLRIPSFSRGWLIEFLPWEKVLTNYYKIAQIKVSKLYTKVIVIYSKTELTAKFKSKN